MEAELGVAQPLVTVITPAYNVAEFIGETIESVAAQTERRFEYIVVDDGSTDDTVEKVTAAFAGDERMRLITHSHQGGAAARNAGIALARAPMISFIDGDDRWHRDKLAHQLSMMNELGEQYGGMFSRSRLISEDGMVVGLQGARPGRHDLDDLLVNNNPARNGSSLMFRRSCFEEVGLFSVDLVGATDFEMELRIAAEASTPLFWADKRYLIDYRLRKGQESRSIDRRLRGVEQILEVYVPRMSRLSPSLAYIDHALFAHKGGSAEYIRRWSDLARSAGIRTLLASKAGRRLMAWRLLGKRGSGVYRRIHHTSLSGARTVVGRLIKAVRSAAR